MWAVGVTSGVEAEQVKEKHRLVLVQQGIQRTVCACVVEQHS